MFITCKINVKQLFNIKHNIMIHKKPPTNPTKIKIINNCETGNGPIKFN